MKILLIPRQQQQSQVQQNNCVDCEHFKTIPSKNETWEFVHCVKDQKSTLFRWRLLGDKSLQYPRGLYDRGKNMTTLKACPLFVDMGNSIEDKERIQ